MRKILLSLLAIFLIVEEWLWEALSAIGQILTEWLHLQRIERWLGQSSPNMALVAFLIPLALVTPLNLAALFLLAQGMIIQGLILEIIAKLLGTFLLARVFKLTKTQLLTFIWINYIYTTISSWLRWAHQRITETAIYQWSKRLKTQIKDRATEWLQKFKLVRK